MLKRLYIKNFTVFNETEWFPGNGMCVITGETGAGKSVMVDALLMATGERNRNGLIRDEKEKCVIEAEFDIKGISLELPEHVEKFENHLIFRRELYPDGRSRIFINDSPVTLQEARNVSQPLLEIHSQHAVIQLKNKAFLFQFLDAVCETSVLYEKEYLPVFYKWQAAEKEKQKLLEKQKELSREKSFLEFQKDEFEVLKEGFEYFLRLEQVVQRLELKQKTEEELSSFFTLLDGGEYAVLPQLHKALRHLQQLEKQGSDAQLSENIQRFSQAITEIKDVQEEMEKWARSWQDFSGNPDVIQEKWDKVNRLMFKYKLKTLSELFEEKKKAEEKYELLENMDVEAEHAVKAADELYAACREVAEKLSRERNKKLKEAQNKIEHALQELCMPHARFVFVCKEKPMPDVYGTDDIQIEFSANPGLRPEPLEKIGSGGEMSRVMLAMRSLMGNIQNTPCMILDEIDTGISGQAALQVGRFIRKMSENKQIFCITHLPQVASQAHHHYRVVKKVTPEGITESEIQYLQQEQRVEEIATMLSHENPGEHAKRNALELLSGQ